MKTQEFKNFQKNMFQTLALIKSVLSSFCFWLALRTCYENNFLRCFLIVSLYYVKNQTNSKN